MHVSVSWLRKVTWQREAESRLKCKVARITINLAFNIEFFRYFASQCRGEAQNWDKEDNNNKWPCHGDQWIFFMGYWCCCPWDERIKVLRNSFIRPWMRFCFTFVWSLCQFTLFRQSKLSINEFSLIFAN